RIEVQVAAERGEPREREDRLALQERAEGDGPIAVGVDEGGKIHQGIRRGAWYRNPMDSKRSEREPCTRVTTEISRSRRFSIAAWRRPARRNGLSRVTPNASASTVTRGCTAYSAATPHGVRS